MVIVTVVVVCVIVTLLVLGLSILTVNKGYAYKHTVDPLPKDDETKSKPASEKENER